MGADYLEQDVVATRDDQLVVLHDVHLDRVTDVQARFPGRARSDGRWYVRDFSLKEIKTLRVHHRRKPDGSPVYPTRDSGHDDDARVLSFVEELEMVQALQQANGRPVGIYPEIKRPQWHRGEGVDVAPRFLGILNEFGYSEHADPVYVQCFDASELRRIRHQLGSRLKLVQLIAENSWDEAPTNFDPLRTSRGLQRLARTVDAVGPWINRLYRVAKQGSAIHSTGLVKRAHAAGLAVHPYTFRTDDLPPGITSPEALLSFCIDELCVDGLFADFPDVVIQFLLKHSARPKRGN